MAQYAVEKTTLPMTAGNKNLVEVYAVDADNFAAAIAAVAKATNATSDEIIKPLGYLSSETVKAYGLQPGMVINIYTTF